jgi:alkanesulfonate monooxygenase SsuD/methylene tetrahydromethanopterin reductase-like flavin-dependent oxidoreductase (luciferase family)
MVEFSDEAVQLMRHALRGGAIRATTPHHRIAGYQAGPVPPEQVGVWVGAQKPKMLAVVGHSSDGWISPLNIYVAPDDVPERQAIIDAAAREAGRDPSDVRRIYNVIGVIGDAPDGAPGLVGGVGHWVDTLTRWVVELGFDTFILWPVVDPPGQLEVFAEQVIPAVRERVALERGRA